LGYHSAAVFVVVTDAPTCGFAVQPVLDSGLPPKDYDCLTVRSRLGERMDNPYLEIGGRANVLALVERFYDTMERDEPALAALHELDAEGHVSRRNRDRFGSFLVGWLGGPDDYIRDHGHPRLRMRHARVPVDVSMRDAWVRCMTAAMGECEIPAAPRAFLSQRFTEVANFLRNVDDAP
jgi:hemoglobin